MTNKKDFKMAEKCTAACLEEVKSCVNYNPSAFSFLQGCLYLNRAGKCMRPPEGVRKK